MYTKYFISILVVLPICVIATEFEQCGSSPMPLAVNIYGCDRPPCDLVTGSDTIMDIIFRNDNFTRTIRPRAVAIVEGLRVPYPLTSNGCPSLVNGYCPLVPGEILKFHFAMPIANFPLISLEIQFSLEGENRMLLNCFQVKCKVV